MKREKAEGYRTNLAQSGEMAAEVLVWRCRVFALEILYEVRPLYICISSLLKELLKSLGRRGKNSKNSKGQEKLT